VALSLSPLLEPGCALGREPRRAARPREGAAGKWRLWCV